MIAVFSRSTAQVLCGIGCLVLLASCSGDSESHAGKVQVSAPHTTQDAIAPISALPPGSGDRPLLPGQSGTEYTPDGLPALCDGS